MASVADISESPAQRAAIPPMPVCRLDVDVYEEMIRAGIITKDSRIELLDGWLVPKMTQNPPHVVAAELVRDALQQCLPDGWCVFSEKPVRVGDGMPEPDAMVVRGHDASTVIGESGRGRGTRRRSRRRQPSARSGLQEDHLCPSRHLRLLACQPHRRAAGGYTDPAGSDETADYRQRRDYSPSDEIPLVLDGRHVASIPVRELLP